MSSSAVLPVSISDPSSFTVRTGKLNSLFCKLLNDRRNLPFLYLILTVALTTIPFAILLFLPGVFNWWMALIYFLYNSIFLMGPVILMQHNVAHKPLFKKNVKALNNIIPWFIGPFFGLTPETYFAHHIGMHHAENNLDPDLSSTMKYQRDSFIDFCKYFFLFLIFGIYDLIKYLYKNRRKKLMRKTLIGELLFYSLVLVTVFINPKASFTVFIFPVFFTRFMMMAGNWAQHAFINTAQPENTYTNSITCINSRYNRTCYNDGYHIGHHLFPTLHWTELPGEFKSHLQKYADENAIIFNKIDFFIVWFLLMTKNYSTLASHYVELNEENPKKKDEIILLLKSRTKRIKYIS